MSITRVIHIHHGMKRWPRPQNHYDGRVCPTCGVTVHGPDAQELHYKDHIRRQERDLRVQGWMAEFAKRTGITEEEFGQDWAWGAQVTGVEAEIEAAE